MDGWNYFNYFTEIEEYFWKKRGRICWCRRWTGRSWKRGGKPECRWKPL